MPTVATPETIWQVPAYLPYVQPPLTDETVASAERQIGHRLPPEYISLLRKQNGGYIRFSLPELVHRRIAGIGPHFPSLVEFDWNDCEDHVSFDLDGLVPFDGDGHWHLCLDYRDNPDTPSVTYVDIELDEQSGIADSFARYLALLRIDAESDYVLEAVSDVDQVKSVLSVLLGASFEPPDSWAHGYPVHRAGLGSEESPEWIWISPNRVPRGFVRTEDPRYHELKNLSQGFALRFPELPPQSYIISATDGVRARVIEACARSGLSARPLRQYIDGI